MANHPKGLTQPLPGEAFKKNGPPWIDAEFSANYPTLYAYMTHVQWEGGGARQTATLTMYVDQHSLTVVLNDRSNNRSLFINEGTMFEALLKLDTVLTDGTADWRMKRDFRSDANKVPF